MIDSLQAVRDENTDLHNIGGTGQAIRGIFTYKNIHYYNDTNPLCLHNLYASRMEIPASETVIYCHKATYPRTNGKIQS